MNEKDLEKIINNTDYTLRDYIKLLYVKNQDFALKIKDHLIKLQITEKEIYQLSDDIARMIWEMDHSPKVKAEIKRRRIETRRQRQRDKRKKP